MDSSQTSKLRLVLHADTTSLQSAAHDLAEAERVHARACDALKIAQAHHQTTATQLAAFRERCTSMRINVSSARRALCTMATFPPELLSMIFSSAVNDRADTFPSPLFDWNAATLPFNISAVSRHWRAVARGTAAVWSNIYVPALKSTEEPAAGSALEYVDHVLTLSKTSLIDLSVHVGSKTADALFRDDDDFYSALFRMLMRVLRRVRTCALHTESKNYNGLPIEQLMLLLRCPTPYLEDLVVTSVFGGAVHQAAFWQGFPRRDFPLLLPDAPRLRRLYIKNAPVICRQPHPGLPSLSFLTLSDSHSDGVYDVHLWDMLTAAPNLEHLVADFASMENAAHPPQPLNSLPITRLALGQDTHWNIATGTVSMPNLQSLSVEGHMVLDLVVSESMARTVTTVAVTYGPLDRDAFGVLRRLEAAEDVTLSADDTITDDAFLFEAMCDPTSPMWPRLRCLVLRNFESEAVERDGLLRLVRVRNSPTADPASGEHGIRPLEKVEFDYSSVPPHVALQVQEILGDKCFILDEV